MAGKLTCVTWFTAALMSISIGIGEVSADELSAPVKCTLGVFSESLKPIWAPLQNLPAGGVLDRQSQAALSDAIENYVEHRGSLGIIFDSMLSCGMDDLTDRSDAAQIVELLDMAIERDESVLSFCPKEMRACGTLRDVTHEFLKTLPPELRRTLGR